MSDNEKNKEEKMPGTEIRPEEDTGKVPTFDDYISALSDQEKDLMVSAWVLLNSSSRFVQFLDANYDINYDVDHEKGSINLEVVEKPGQESPAITLTPGKVFHMHQELLNAGIRPAAKVVRTIVDILQKAPQDEDIIITNADIDTVKQETQDHEILQDIIHRFATGSKFE